MLFSVQCTTKRESRYEIMRDRETVEKKKMLLIAKFRRC